MKKSLTSSESVAAMHAGVDASLLSSIKARMSARGVCACPVDPAMEELPLIAQREAFHLVRPD